MLYSYPFLGHFSRFMGNFRLWDFACKCLPQHTTLSYVVWMNKMQYPMIISFICHQRILGKDFYRITLTGSVKCRAMQTSNFLMQHSVHFISGCSSESECSVGFPTKNCSMSFLFPSIKTTHFTSSDCFISLLLWIVCLYFYFFLCYQISPSSPHPILGHSLLIFWCLILISSWYVNEYLSQMTIIQKYLS